MFQIIEKISDLETEADNNFSLILPNSNKCGCISKQVADKILNHVHM